MEKLSRLYQAYADYQEAVAPDSRHEDWMRVLQEPFPGTEEYQDQCTTLLWDHEWIDAFETAFPFIENAIEEQRRFIESFSEIRRVDQARKTTVDSVRHLAEHSNLISRVNGDEVIPDKILIVQREDNYAIYENRFLYTLIQQMDHFLQSRYSAALEANGKRQMKVRFHRDGRISRTQLHSELSFTLEQTPARPAGMKEAYEGMSDMERVELLVHRVDMLSSAPLMRELKGCRPVTAPIVRTNVFKNNENFKQALNLFDFLQRYQKTGYEIITDQRKEAACPEDLRLHLSELAILETLIGRMTLDPDLAEGLANDRALAKEKQHLETKIQENDALRDLHSQVTLARREETVIREREIALREEVIEQKEQEIAHQREEISSRDHQLETAAEENAKLEERLAEAKMEIQRVEAALAESREETRQALAREAQERRLRREDLEHAKEEILQARREAEQSILQAREQAEERIAAAKQDAEAAIERVRQSAGSSIRQAQEGAETAIREAKESAEALAREAREAADLAVQKAIRRAENAEAEAETAKQEAKSAQSHQKISDLSAAEAQRQLRDLREKNNSLQKQLIQARQAIKKSEEKSSSRKNLNHVARKIWNG